MAGRVVIAPWAQCIGPVVNLGIANPVGFGLHARVGEHLGFGVDYQFLPEVTIESADTTASLVTADARVYPFGGGFFVSAGVAYQVITAVGSESLTDGAGQVRRVDARGSVHIPMIKLGLGFFGHKGFVLGIDLAAGVPLTDTRVDLAATYSGFSPGELAQAAVIEAQARQDAQDAVDSVLAMMPVLLQVNLLRVGYTF